MRGGEVTDDLYENPSRAHFFEPLIDLVVYQIIPRGGGSVQKKLMKVVDTINFDMGSGAIRYGAVGLARNQSWKTAFNQRSRPYNPLGSDLTVENYKV